jgi:pilus assembly protein CpaF
MRVETMVAMANFDIPAVFVRRYVSSALDVIIHLERMTDGSRKVTSLQEITGMEGDTITLQEVFSFEKTSIDAQGKVKGRFLFHGIRPRFIDKFNVMGIHIPPELFDRAVIEAV